MKKTHRKSKIMKIRSGYKINEDTIKQERIIQRVIYPDGSELIEYIPVYENFNDEDFY